jgi:hypothetical protein
MVYPANFGAEFQSGESKILFQTGDGNQAVTGGWTVGKHVVVAYLQYLSKLEGIVVGGGVLLTLQRRDKTTLRMPGLSIVD